MSFYYNVTGNETAGLIYLIYQFLPSIIGLVGYVFLALGLYTIAQRRGLSNPWLAWIPVANVWLLGSISDQYQQMTRNKKTNRRKILLWLEIALYVLMIIMVIVLFVFAFQMEMVEDGLDPYYDYYDYISYSAEAEAEMMSSVLSFALVLLCMVLVVMVAAIVQTVFLYMSYYDLFVSCDPKNATLFLILSIAFGVATPFFVFAVRNKDLGMQPPAPPQWGQPGYYPPQPQYYQPPVQHYQPPVQHYQPPVQHYQPPVQHYQPPVQHYQPPVQPYQPPVQYAQPSQQIPQPPVTAPVQETPAAPVPPAAPLVSESTTPENTEI